MNLFRLPVFLALSLFSGAIVHAETAEERARKVTVTMNLTADVPASAAAHFVEVLSNIQVHFQGATGDTILRSISFENASADAALRYIAQLSNLELTYQADGAHFAPRK